MARVFPEDSPVLDPNNVPESLDKIERYLRYIQERVEHMNYAQGKIDERQQEELALVVTRDGTSVEINDEEIKTAAGYDGLNTRITQNATSIQSEVTNRTNADSALSSRITQNANSISAEVTDRQNADTSLTSSINVQKNRIDLVVKESSGQNVIKAAEIVTAINSAGSSVKISADHITLSGDVVMKSNLYDGTTRIDGGNITTGTISADRIAAGSIAIGKLATTLQTTINDASSNASTALTNASAAQSTANASVKRSQVVYYRAASGTTSLNKPTTWITSTSNSGGGWRTKPPQYSASYPVLFVATQWELNSGTISSNTPAIDNTLTVIDGGMITTGTINANTVSVTNINADNIKSGTLTSREINNGNGTFHVDVNGNVTANSLTSTNARITGGSINISSDSATYDTITLTYGQSYTQLGSARLCVCNEGNGYTTQYEGGGILTRKTTGSTSPTIDLSFGTYGGGLILRNPDGSKYTANLWSSSQGGRLDLYDENGNSGSFLFADPSDNAYLLGSTTSSSWTTVYVGSWMPRYRAFVLVACRGAASAGKGAMASTYIPCELARLCTSTSYESWVQSAQNGVYAGRCYFNFTNNNAYIVSSGNADCQIRLYGIT